eukprot:490729-Rhodomonas_salina.2
MSQKRMLLERSAADSRARESLGDCLVESWLLSGRLRPELQGGMRADCPRASRRQEHAASRDKWRQEEDVVFVHVAVLAAVGAHSHRGLILIQSTMLAAVWAQHSLHSARWMVTSAQWTRYLSWLGSHVR